MDPSTKRLLILVGVNSPVVYVLWTWFFDDWSDFLQAFLPTYYFAGSFMNFDNYKLLLFLMLCGGLFYGESRFFEGSVTTETPVSKVSWISPERLTFRSTRTPPSLSPVLAQLPASPASLSASVQADLVSFIR